jgi:chaperone BCS1
VRRQVTLEITSKDRSYPWVLAWLTRQAAAGRSGFGGASTLAQHVSVTTSVEGSNVASTDGSGGNGGGGSGDVKFDFAPCPGRHFVGYKGRLLRVRVRRLRCTLSLSIWLV